MHASALQQVALLTTATKPLTTTSALIERCRNGDTAAQREFIDRYQTFVFRVALRLLGNYHQAEDCSQEVFIKALERIATFKGETAVETWLYRVTANHCLDHLRRETRARKAHENGGTWSQDAIASPETELITAETREAIVRAVASLPAKYRTVYLMHHWEELPYEEIARIEGTSVSAIKMRIARGRELLLVRLAAWYEPRKR